MALNLHNYERLVEEAVCFFWDSRSAARRRQEESGIRDQGERASVTAGKNMDGFVDLIISLVQNNGLDRAQIHENRSVLTLPGFFRATKEWDLIIMADGELVAVLELKSQVGPSFGNNFNNRAEEAIGSAVDFWTSFREGALGTTSRPFLGWLMLVEDAEGSRSPVQWRSPHFPVFREFEGASYLERYDLLAQKLMLENLYTSASVIASPRDNNHGSYRSLSAATSIRNFVTSLAGHIAYSASRTE